MILLLSVLVINKLLWLVNHVLKKDKQKTRQYFCTYFILVFRTLLAKLSRSICKNVVSCFCRYGTGCFLLYNTGHEV